MTNKHKTASRKEAKPFLRWAGSKQKLLPILSTYWESSFSRYIEPFVGSGQLLLKLDWDQAIIGDLNVELIEVYNQIKKNPYQVYRYLKKFEVSEHEYYRVRSTDPRTLGINQRAARFMYLNRFCFNGIYRTNNKGEFNVPFNYSSNKTVCDYENLLIVSKKLKRVSAFSTDFEDLIRRNVRSKDFIYLDPPYAVTNQRIFKQYGPQTFGLDDLSRIAGLLNFIDKKRAGFLLSYADCKEAREEFAGWKIKTVETQRNISGFAQYRRKANEILVSNI